MNAGGFSAATLSLFHSCFYYPLGRLGAPGTASFVTIAGRVVKFNALNCTEHLPIQLLRFYVLWTDPGRVCVTQVNIHQEATYVCVGDHQPWNNSPALPESSPAPL